MSRLVRNTFLIGWPSTLAFAAPARRVLRVSFNMERTKLTLLIFLAILNFPAFSADVEFISQEKQHELESKFDTGHFSANEDTQAIKSHEWTCEMYGMRTRLQVQRGLKLYKWNASAAEWHNRGAQVVSDYKAEKSALVGRRDRFEDQVRLTKDGQLVSRLSLVSPTNTVVAYSVCKTL